MEMVTRDLVGSNSVAETGLKGEYVNHNQLPLPLPWLIAGYG
jgi:hypothetical protein